MSWRKFRKRVWWDGERAHEIDCHLAMEAAENVARGMHPTDAVAAARRKFGNPVLIREDIYRMNSLQWLEEVRRDLGYALRGFRLNPAFFAVAVLSLVLGIGANTAIFQMLDALRLRMLPVAHPEQLVKVHIADDGHCCTGHFSNRNSDFTYAQWEQIRDNQKAFSSIAAWGDKRFNLSERGESQYAEGMWVSGDFFKVLGVHPLIGHLITPADDRPGCASPGVVISYGFWQRHFGGQSSVLGREVSLGGHKLPVIGVTAPGFFGVEVGRSFDVAVPTCIEPVIDGEDSHLSKRHHWWLGILGRLTPGWTMKRAAAQLAAISPGVFANTVPENYTPETTKYYLQYKLAAIPAGSGVSDLRAAYDAPLVLLLIIAGLVLLIACANLANLMLARASAREREIAIRLAIGAGRGAVLRQMLSESLLIAALGAGGGILAAQVISRYLATFLNSRKDPVFLDIHPDWRVLAFTAAVGLLTCLVFGLFPALRGTRIAPVVALKTGARGATAGRETFGVRRFLVVTQVALSVVLLVGALLFTGTLRKLLTADAGFRESGLLIASIDLSRSDIPIARRAQLNGELLEQVRDMPGVENAASARVIPLDGNYWNEEIRFEEQKDSRRREPMFNMVSRQYFRTIGAKLLAGRNFDDHDTLSAPNVAIVDQEFVRAFLGDADPLGKVFRVVVGPSEPQRSYQIIGVVSNAKYTSLREAFKPTAFLAATQDPEPRAGLTLLVRSREPLGALLPRLQKAILAVSPNALLDFQSFAAQVRDSLLRERLMALLSGFFGALAVVLAIVGLYGVIAYMVARRSNEIGIRVALGAGRGRILRLVLGEAGLLVAAGLTIGTLLALAAARAAKALLYGLQPSDFGTLASAVLLLSTAAFLASFLPALRASGIDPMQALREE